MSTAHQLPPAQAIYTVNEAAAYSRFCPETIYRAVRGGGLRKLPGERRAIRITHAALVDWLNGEEPLAAEDVRVSSDTHVLVDDLVRGAV